MTCYSPTLVYSFVCKLIYKKAPLCMLESLFIPYPLSLVTQPICGLSLFPDVFIWTLSVLDLFFKWCFSSFLCLLRYPLNIWTDELYYFLCPSSIFITAQFLALWLAATHKTSSVIFFPFWKIQRYALDSKQGRDSPPRQYSPLPCAFPTASTNSLLYTACLSFGL